MRTVFASDRQSREQVQPTNSTYPYDRIRSSSRILHGKLTRYLALLLFGAFAGSAIAQNTPKVADIAGSALTYDDGDLFLGFRSTDGTSDYLVNILQPAQFVNAPPGSTFQVVRETMSADLAVAFGSDWYTRIDPNTGRTPSYGQW